MKKKLLVGVGSAAATIALLAIGMPAQAFTPTLSEVRVLNGPPSDESIDGLTITSEAQTAVVVSARRAWVVDVTSNVATEITGLTMASRVIMNSAETFAYVATGQFKVSKVDVATATVVDTWTDATLGFSVEQMFLSADGLNIYAVGVSGSFPNIRPGVVKLDLTSGVISKFDAVNLGALRQAAFNAESGEIFIPYSLSSTTSFAVFDTASESFTDIPWAAAGDLTGCDWQAGTMACLVEGTVPYVATVSPSGAVESSLDVDVAVSNLVDIRVTPDGMRAYVLGDNGGFGAVQAVDLSDMSSVLVLDTLLEYPEVVALAPDAGQIWFYAYYAEDYNGGYQVVHFADPTSDEPQASLADTGVDASDGVVTAITIGTLGVVLVVLHLVRRRTAANAK
jgi:hypothetical protein